MSRCSALYDANVLYPFFLRDILVQLAITDLFRARWTDDIHNEWMNNLLDDRPDLSRKSLEKTRDLMNANVRDCLITGYEARIPSLKLPDPNDRHVLAAAIVGECNLIVTRDIKHFPKKALSEFGIEARHPDEFLCGWLESAPDTFCSSVKKARMRLKKRPYAVIEYLDILKKQGLVACSAKLEQFAEFL